MAVLDIVTVQYTDESTPGEFAGRNYSYYADVPLKVGDCVAVPSRRGTSLAKVTEIGIPDYRVESRVKEIMRHITTAPVPPPKPRRRLDPEQLDLFE